MSLSMQTFQQVRQRDLSWEQAMQRAKTFSDAADAALFDLQRASHRPGGTIKLRARFATDERNVFGNWG